MGIKYLFIILPFFKTESTCHYYFLQVPPPQGMEVSHLPFLMFSKERKNWSAHYLMELDGVSFKTTSTTPSALLATQITSTTRTGAGELDTRWISLKRQTVLEDTFVSPNVSGFSN